MLDDDEGVAEVAQPGQRADEALVVALVQPDGRLVEHVEDADEAGADLGGQPDALRLAAGQRARGAVEAEVVQAHVEEEAEPGVDLAQHAVGDGVLALATARGRAGTPAASPMVSDDTSAMLRPDTVTARTSGRSRAPSQTGQGTSRM